MRINIKQKTKYKAKRRSNKEIEKIISSFRRGIPPVFILDCLFLSNISLPLIWRMEDCSWLGGWVWSVFSTPPGSACFCSGPYGRKWQNWPICSTLRGPPRLGGTRPVRPQYFQAQPDPAIHFQDSTAREYPNFKKNPNNNGNQGWTNHNRK